VVMFVIFYGYYPFGSISGMGWGYLRIIFGKVCFVNNRSLLTLPYDKRSTEISSFFQIILSKNFNQRMTNFIEHIHSIEIMILLYYLI
jgi:hypothetical protein